MTDTPPQPLEPIEIHAYYACSWIVNHHGLNQMRDLVDIADEMHLDLRVRKMFTDQYGYVIYPFTVKVADEQQLHAFVKQAAAGAGMEAWYIVNLSYFEKGIPFVENFRTVITQMPRWEENMRQYADHNAALYDRLKANPPQGAE
jgi:hypothetical protein